MSFRNAQLTTFIAAALLAATATPVVLADGLKAERTVIYMTRHAEKQNELDKFENSFCRSDLKRCAEELSALGELRAEFLADWLEERGILRDLTDVISSDKQRTRQTVAPSAARAMAIGIDLGEDKMDGKEDGVRQVPADVANIEGNEIESNSGSVDPTVAAIRDLEPGSVALVAAHSGTIYKIMGGEDTDGNADTGKDDSIGLGIDTTVGDNQADITLFPKKESDGKVPTFGDLWKIVINHNTGEAKVVWRKNLQPQRLRLENQSIIRGNHVDNRMW